VAFERGCGLISSAAQASVVLSTQDPQTGGSLYLSTPTIQNAESFKLGFIAAISAVGWYGSYAAANSFTGRFFGSIPTSADSLTAKRNGHNADPDSRPVAARFGRSRLSRLRIRADSGFGVCDSDRSGLLRFHPFQRRSEMAGRYTRRWCFALLLRGWPKLEFLAARSLADPHWQTYRHGRTRAHFAGTRRSGPGCRCERSLSPAFLSPPVILQTKAAWAAFFMSKAIDSPLVKLPPAQPPQK